MRSSNQRAVHRRGGLHRVQLRRHEVGGEGQVRASALELRRVSLAMGDDGAQVRFEHRGDMGRGRMLRPRRARRCACASPSAGCAAGEHASRRPAALRCRLASGGSDFGRVLDVFTRQRPPVARLAQRRSCCGRDSARRPAMKRRSLPVPGSWLAFGRAGVDALTAAHSPCRGSRAATQGRGLLRRRPRRPSDAAEDSARLDLVALVSRRISESTPLRAPAISTATLSVSSFDDRVVIAHGVTDFLQPALHDGFGAFLLGRRDDVDRRGHRQNPIKSRDLARDAVDRRQRPFHQQRDCAGSGCPAWSRRATGASRSKKASLGDDRGDLRAEAAGQNILVHDEAAARLAHRGEHRVAIPWHQGAQIENLDRRRASAAASSQRSTIAPQVTMVRSRALATRARLAERQDEIIAGIRTARRRRIEHGAMLEENRRIVAAQRRAQQADGVLGVGRHRDLPAAACTNCTSLVWLCQGSPHLKKPTGMRTTIGAAKRLLVRQRIVPQSLSCSVAGSAYLRN